MKVLLIVLLFVAVEVPFAVLVGTIVDHCGRVPKVETK